MDVYLSGKTLSKGELLIVANLQPLTDALEIYAQRWQIETLFECMKMRGFNLEDTHITDHEKISRKLSVLTIAYCWAYKAGIWQCEQCDGITKKTWQLSKKLFLSWLRLPSANLL